MRLNFARLLMDREPEKAKDELFKLENLARRTTKEIRTMLFMLRPVTLETQGLKVAIEQLVERLQETGQLPIQLEIEDVEQQLEANVKAVAWFIVREALNNAKKYADASNIWVRAYVRDGRFVAEVEDDGVGFDFEKTMANYDQRGSFGLLNFQERADLVNGRATIRSTPGHGTKITLTVPLSREGS
jgi:signal transduction histidine kinase